MKTKAELKTEVARDYITYVRARLKTINYQAERKIKLIDAMADIIFTARSNYRNKINQ